MRKFEYTITDPAGLHARPAGLLVKKAKEYAARITISANGRECEATRLMALMGMGVRSGATVTVTVDGADEQRCAGDLEAFFRQNL